MAKINIILQGFVDINLETDENIGTKIVPTNGRIQNTNTIVINETVQRRSSSKSIALPSTIELPVPIEDIFEGIGVNLASIQSLHIQGSRLYGVESIQSDWDLSAISTESTYQTFEEVKVDGNEFDIKLFSQEEFQRRLDNHDMRELEYIYHPDSVKVVNNREFTVEIDKEKLIERVKFESSDLWNRGQEYLETGSRDPYIALKNFWHSLRFLIFAEQILKDGSITDFKAANYLYDPIVNSNQTDYDFFEINFSELREVMKLNLNTYL